MDVLVYASDMGSLDHRLDDMSIGDEFIRHFSRYSHDILPGGYEYATLQRLSDGHVFRVRMEKLVEHFVVKNDSSK